MTKIVIVAAVGENNVIGFRGGMPWHLRSDLAHFRALTINKPVVMGRKTFASLGRPLPQRTNIVVTRDTSLVIPGVVLASSIEAALVFAREDAKERSVDEIMIIGGSDIFIATMPLAERLEITHVHASPEGDVRFPPIDPAIWQEVSRKEHPAGPHDTASFAVAVYKRR